MQLLFISHFPETPPYGCYDPVFHLLFRFLWRLLLSRWRNVYACSLSISLFLSPLHWRSSLNVNLCALSWASFSQT